MEILWGVISGVVGGIFAGMGMGGGTALIPILTILMGFNQLNAQSINLLSFLPLALITLIIHTKNKLVDYKNTYITAILGVIGAVGGSILASIVKPKILKIAFGIFLALLGIYQLIMSIIMEKESKNKTEFSKIYYLKKKNVINISK
jgi:uncharacterized protein